MSELRLLREKRREGSREIFEPLPLPEGGCRKAGKGFFTGAWGDGTKENGL